MKLLAFLFLLAFVSNTYAQKTFARVYDLAGNKIAKGHIFTLTDSSLLLVGKTEPLTILVTNIGYIKTKHSAGNNLLIGSASGALTGAIIGAASADPDAEILGYTAGEGAGAGALLGLSVGAAIGGLTILFKHSETFLINGDVIKWKVFQSYVSAKTATAK